MRRMTKRRTPLGVMTVVFLGWGREQEEEENKRKLEKANGSAQNA
jgi:hypothetical protein